MLHQNVLLYSHVQGLAGQLEREAQAESAGGMSPDQWVDAQAPALAALTASRHFPTFTRVLGALGENGYDLDLDELFEIGLTSLLDGLAVRIEAHAAPRTR